MNMEQIKQEFVPTIKSCMTEKYLTFEGRTGQNEFITFMIFSVLVSIIAYSILLPSLAGLICLALLAPSLAVTVRRLNDAGMQNILALLLIIPLVNLVFIAYLAVQPSKV